MEDEYQNEVSGVDLNRIQPGWTGQTSDAPRMAVARVDLIAK